jgi:putative (di)nucleoside polyphosphate hydrolase
MILSEAEAARYRAGAGIMLLNREGHAFVGRRIDMPGGLSAWRTPQGGIAVWQMPQGGIDPGESPREAALRELKEEIGTDCAVIIAESRGWLHYDLPPEIVGGAWGGRYRGQRQKWFLMRFTGEDGDIDPGATEHPEFDAWEWVETERLPDLIVPFKRQLYLDILAEFRDYCRPSHS